MASLIYILSLYCYFTVQYVIFCSCAPCTVRVCLLVFVMHKVIIFFNAFSKQLLVPLPRLTSVLEPEQCLAGV